MGNGFKFFILLLAGFLGIEDHTSFRGWAQEKPLASEPEAIPAAGTPTPETPSPAVTPSAVPPTQADAALVRKWVRQLEANQLIDRDTAERKLVEMGSSILPDLPAVTPRTSGELKIRLERIRTALQGVEVESFFKASRVTLRGAYSVGDALKQISEQTQNPIELQGEGEGRQVELTCDGVTFWEAVEQVMQQAKLRIRSFSTTEDLLVLGVRGNLEAEDSEDSGVRVQPFQTGPFRIDALSTRTSLPLGGGADGMLEFSFLVSWEPRLKPIFMRVPRKSLQGTAGEATELQAANPAAAPEFSLNLGGCSTQVDVQLQRPPRSERSLSNVQGEFVMAVPGERHQYIFKNFANGTRQTEKFGDVTVTLEGARRNGAVHEMRLMVQFGDSQGALDSFRGWIMSNEAYLLDANEQRQENVGLQTYATQPNAAGIAYLFQINGDPDDYRLVYESPAAITQQTVQYQLRDIPLP
ncbi:hypothetical protein [Aureliella helgolandensis]|uniref:hypothetical protein n=1 Tax=Aureliella helgolandensis TaxID=2527968 RepID=UPI0018D0F962|nr:hypothetical protein [Aureliella helgolandensis]